MKILEGIAKGEQAIREGRTMDMSQAKEKMSKGDFDGLHSYPADFSFVRS